MSEEQNKIPINEEDKKRIENAFFGESVKILPQGVLVRAINLKKEEVDVAITNADIANIYNAINGESPFDAESNE